jgi:hypothetical protein
MVNVRLITGYGVGRAVFRLGKRGNGTGRCLKHAIQAGMTQQPYRSVTRRHVNRVSKLVPTGEHAAGGFVPFWIPPRAVQLQVEISCENRGLRNAVRACED